MQKQDQKVVKSFGELEVVLKQKTGAKEKEKSVDFSFNVTRAGVSHNGLLLTNNCVVKIGGMRFVCRLNSRHGTHFAVEDATGKFCENVMCRGYGNYTVTATVDYLGAVTITKKYDMPIEMETDPVRIVMRERGLFPSRKMLICAGQTTALPYNATTGQKKRSKAPAGSMCVSFTSDGVECVDVKSIPGIKDGPVAGKVRGASFLIQYSTRFGKNGRPRRWVEHVIITDSAKVRLPAFTAALDQVLDVKSHPAQLFQYTEPEAVPTQREPVAEVSDDSVTPAEHQQAAIDQGMAVAAPAVTEPELAIAE